MSLRPKLKYLAYGLLSNTALKAYWLAPREAMQHELLLLHRWALKKAHDARMEDPREKNACAHRAALEWEEVRWCSSCGAINPVSANDIPVDEWTRPTGPDHG